MTSSSPVSPRQRHAGPWLCVGAVTGYVLASPFFLRNTPDGALWVVLWILLGVAAIALVITGLILSTQSDREQLDELHHLHGENRDLAALAETRRAALENLVDHQLPAANKSAAPPPLPEAGRDEFTATLLGRAVAQLGRYRDDRRAGQDAVQAAVVSLGRKVQASAHRIQEEAARMVQRHPTDPDVLHTSMRVDHAAAQQARNAQSLATLCGEAPGQQWHQALPLADVVRGAAGRITAYQRVEVSGDPGVAVSARVVEPLIHVIAELLGNATQSSPPTTQVLVSLRHVQRGAVIEIDDGGVGLDDSRLEQVREIASGRRPVSLSDLGEIPQTGLAVVGAYVRRHGFRVDLTESVYGGLRAIILVPAELTEPVAPSGVVSAGGHVLTRRPERQNTFEQPQPAPVPEPYREPPLTAVSEPDPLPEPVPEPVADSLPDDRPETVSEPVLEPVSEPALESRPRPVADDPVGVANSGESPELPRRRSRRGEASRPAMDWHPRRDAEPQQTAEQAGQWMGAFLATARPPNPSDHHDRVSYADDNGEEQR